jgi:hypothetical protein
MYNEDFYLICFIIITIIFIIFLIVFSSQMSSFKEEATIFCIRNNYDKFIANPFVFDGDCYRMKNGKREYMNYKILVSNKLKEAELQ